MAVHIIGPKDSRPDDAIDTTSRSKTWSRGLSPFFVGPIDLYGGFVARNMENAWQFSKVYPEDVGADGTPSEDYWEWAKAGWADERAHRYPKGRGRVPAYSWWDGEKLTYVEARKRIYFPLYAKAVAKTAAFLRLQEVYRREEEITLWDFDGYDHRALGMDYKDVLNDPKRKMGHAFVLGYLLEGLQ